MLVTVFFTVAGFSQFNIVSFKVTDSQTGEGIKGVQVLDVSTSKAKLSNIQGSTKFAIDNGEREFVFSAPAYITKQLSIRVMSDSLLIVELLPTEKSIIVGEVTITAGVIHKKREEAKVSKITAQKSPSIGGTTDIAKILVKQAGVQEVNEGSGEVLVRGGLPKHTSYLVQNRIKLTTSAALGLVSPLNGLTISETVLNKSYISPKYTDFLSGVVLMQPQKPNLKQPKLTLNLNPFISQVYLSTPIIKGNTAVSASARHTVFPYVKKVYNIEELENIKYTDYSFAAYSEFTNEFSFAANFDYMNDNLTDSPVTSSGADYSTKTITQNTDTDGELMLTHRNLTRKIDIFTSFTNHAVLFDDYNTVFEGIETEVADYTHTELYAGFSVENRNKKHSYNYGAKAKTLFVSPYVQKITNNVDTSNDTINVAAQINSLHPYFEFSSLDESKLSYTIGLGINTLLYNNTLNVLPEPRVLLKYPLSKKANAELAYIKSHRVLQYISNTTLGVPRQLPVIAQSSPPAATDQISATFNFGTNGKVKSIELLVSTYLKQTKNTLWFKEWQTLDDVLYNKQTAIEEKLQAYHNQSAGIELSLSGKLRKLQFGANYTYSRTYLKIAETNVRKVSPFDIPHSLNIDVRKDFNKKLSLSLNWAYHTGLPLEFPLFKYEIPSFDFANGTFTGHSRQSISYTGDKTYRMDAYHRLDVSLVYKLLKTKRQQHTLRLDVVNLYNRHNPYYLSTDWQPANNPNSNAWKNVLSYSYLLPIIPTIGYKFEF